MALASLFFFLHLNPLHNRKTFRQHVSEFDFLGLFLIVVGVVCLLLGFNFSETSCSSWLLGYRTLLILSSLGKAAKTIALVAVGVALLLAAVVNELFTKRSAIIPPRLFKVCLFVSWGA